MKKTFPVELQFLLVDTMCEVFYWKKSLLLFLSNMKIPAPLFRQTKSLLSQNTKRDTLNYLIDALLKQGDIGLASVEKMLDDLSSWSSFRAAQDAKYAQQMVNKLAQEAEKYRIDKVSEKENLEEKRKVYENQKASSLKFEKYDALLQRYFSLFKSENPQERGRELETLLHDIFELEGLNPEQAFTLKGEQIDGAFELDSTHYLVEAKWQKDKVSPDQVSWFGTKVSKRISGTRGLMISIEGYTEGSVNIASETKSIILMNGDDLYHVLDPRIDLTLKELLHHKIAIFARYGISFATARDYLND